MDGKRYWGSSQGPPTRSSYWAGARQPSQPVLQSSQFGRQPEDDILEQRRLDLPVIHDSFYALGFGGGMTPASSLPRRGQEFHQAQDHEDVEDGVDDFDRQVLEMSELPASHPHSARRLTLPQVQLTSRPDLETSSQQAQGCPSIYEPADQPQVQSITMFAPGYQQRALNPLLPRFGTRSELDPATTTTTIRVPGEQHRDLQPRLQHDAGPSYSASHEYEQSQALPTPPGARRRSHVETSSPLEGVSLRRQSRWQNKHPHRNEDSPMPPTQRPSPTDSSPKAVQAPPVVNGIQLISPRRALPDTLFYRSIFPYPVFNAVQSKCFESVYKSCDNLVVSAPTGSGKTAIFELAICKLVADKGPENIKIVYQAPTKALCAERARDWQAKFSALKLECAELTGDTSQSQLRKVGNATIIVTTPEKWDSVTRKWRDHRKLLELVALFLIDEVHILKDMRGATLEAVVSRMKAIGSNVRFVALSATIPNSEDIATWLGQSAENQHLAARRETFGDEFRPVSLERHVFGYDKHMNDHAFDKILTTKLLGLLPKYTEGKPILVFCFTRKSCETTASALADWWKSLPDRQKPWHKPTISTRVVSRELPNLLEAGVAFHHAGLIQEDRQATEKAFLRGDLSVICCTSTLAVGVNLPCHTVVLKGTVTYQNDAIHELSDLESLQMLGRAGRPQFDSSANALILTSSDQKERYERMSSGEEILESTLHCNLIEHLNSEVGLGTIGDMESAKRWLAGTFLSVRMSKNPGYYHLSDSAFVGKDRDAMLADICERNIKQLQEYRIITSDEVFKQTAYGDAMARYMVEFNTMKLLLNLPKGSNVKQVLNDVAKANEFREFKFKPADGLIFRAVNKSPFILYPIEENVTKTWHKVSLLVQLHLGGADYPDTSESQKQKQQLRIEKKGIFERLQRLVRCVADCKVHDRDSVSTKSALELVRSLTADAWEDRPSELLQIAHIGPILMRKLVSRGVMRIKDLVHKDPGELAGLLGRNPTFGKTLTDQLKAFPLLSCDVTVPNRKYTFINDGEAISVPLIATLRYLNQAGLPKWRNNVPLVTFVAETTAGLLVYFWKGYLDRIDSSTGLELLFSAEIRTQNERFMCHFSCEEIVGTIVTKTLDHAVPVSAFKKLKPMVQQVEAAALPRTSSNSGPKGAADGLRPARRSDPALWEDALDDEDAIEAAAAFDEGSTPPEDVHNGNRKEDSQQSAQTSYSDGDFPLVEDILAVVDPPKQVSLSLAGLSLTPSSFRTTQEAPSEADTVEKAPVKLPNGKWQCNHACSRGALTKGGKPCAHRCCIEGLDKPRKMKTQEQKLAEAKKRRAVHLLAKKRKGEGELDECSNADTASHGRSIKRIRVSQEPEPSRVTTNTPQKPCSESTGAEDAKDVQGKVSRFVSVDMSDLGENSDFPDVTVLAHSKSKNAASDADDVNVERLSPSWTATETYEPTVPPAATTDYGNLDDLFNEDFEFDFEMPDMAHQVSPSASDTGPLWRMPRDTGGAFKLEGQDTMLTDLALHATPPQLGDWTRSPTPKSYKPVLKEAAKVGDIRFPNMSAYHHMTTALPDLGDLGSLDFGAFDDGSVDGGSMDGDSRDDGSFDEELMAFVEAEDISAEDGTISPRPPSDAFAEAPLGHAPVGQQEPDVKQNTTEGKKKEKEKEAEPAWVAEFDQDFVNSFRGHVNFI